ncbi:MAG: TolC family protein [Terrimicrobiaceae bacterium]
MNSIRLLIFVFVAIPTLSAHAEISLTAEAAAKLAREKNPELVAARNLIEEAQARTFIVGRLANPELSAEIAGGQDFEGRVSVGITQRFPLTARLRLERELSAIDVEIARLEVRNRERQIEVAARSAFYELASARSSIAQARQQSALAQAFAETIAEGVPQGFGSQIDGGQAALEAETLRTAGESLRSLEADAAGQLNTLLGRSADAPIVIKDPLDLPKAMPAKRAVGVRADLLLAEAAVRSGATGVSLAKASRWDDVGVGVFIEGERFADEPEGIEPEALVGIQFSMPLPIWQNGSGKVAEKQAAQTRLAKKLEALRFSIRNEALAAHAILSARHRSAMDLTSKLVPAARKQVTDAEAAYARGEIDITTVFRTREKLVEIEANALESRKNYFVAYAEWIATLGEPSTQP